MAWVGCLVPEPHSSDFRQLPGPMASWTILRARVRGYEYFVLAYLPRRRQRRSPTGGLFTEILHAIEKMFTEGASRGVRMGLARNRPSESQKYRRVGSADLPRLRLLVIFRTRPSAGDAEPGVPCLHPTEWLLLKTDWLRANERRCDALFWISRICNVW
jgi:hypothetical protein